MYNKKKKKNIYIIYVYYIIRYRNEYRDGYRNEYRNKYRDDRNSVS